jgi:hypothetical protein
MLRVHDVAETRDFLTVSAALNGELETPKGLHLRDELRWEQPSREAEQRVFEEAVHERVG